MRRMPKVLLRISDRPCLRHAGACLFGRPLTN
jgi:hypothetical protein